jgi:hypothetical protein
MRERKRERERERKNDEVVKERGCGEQENLRSPFTDTGGR